MSDPVPAPSAAPSSAGLETERDQVLGYLNFSAGSPDPQFLTNLNKLFAATATPAPATPAPAATATVAAASEGSPDKAVWRVVVEGLEQRLGTLRGQSPAFADAAQAEGVLRLVVANVVPGYFEFHRDLLFHQNERSLCNSLFLGRVFEAILRQGGPWDEADRITRGAIRNLNDYVGHRPLATLERRKMEPYAHEWVRPVPLYVRGAGLAPGPHAEVVAAALRLIEDADPALRHQAHFDPSLLDELAYDPRAYDFDHPANKRPNYHFGHWDPNHIDNQGRYRRYVIQEVTLRALMRRLEDEPSLPRHELLFEAAAVLAGTILMASGVSGRGPDAHDSTVTLSNLLPRIARYRDEFYVRLLRKMSGPHAERLKAEAVQRQQPFGGARQHLNAELARQRASQLERVQLAKIFANMGFPEAAARQVDIVPTASARILCQIDCWLLETHRAVRVGQIDAALKLFSRIRELLRRGIECGAVIDPWNILGFDANYSLFPAIENSVHDHRADELCEFIDHFLTLYGQAWSEAVARRLDSASQQIKRQFRELVDWWHAFATHTVTGVDAVNALDKFRDAEVVAGALRLWNEAGTAAGNVAFWAPHAELFQSAHAYAMVLDKLLAHRDFVASRGLLMHWLSQASRVGLTSGDSAFAVQAESWLVGLFRDPPGDDPPTTQERQHRWNVARKFFDFLEVNAEDYWQVPDFQLSENGSGGPKPQRRPRRDSGESKPGNGSSGSFLDVGDGELDGGPDDLNDDALEMENEDGERDDGADGLFDSAYQGVVFRGSTEDGVEGSIFETDTGSQDELMREAKRIGQRLDFLTTVARLWRLAALQTVRMGQLSEEPGAVGETDERLARVAAWDRAGALERWATQATTNYDDLLDLLESVRAYRLPEPSARQEALIEYDQRRYAKEMLMEQIVETAIETIDSRRLLLSAALAQIHGEEVGTEQTAKLLTESMAGLDQDQRYSVHMLSSAFRNDSTAMQKRWPELIKTFRRLPLLYVPLARNGEPRQIVAARLRHRTLQDLLICIPRRGNYLYACQLLDAARLMERGHNVGPGAVTEFDELFKVGFKSMVASLIESTTTTGDPSKPAAEGAVEPKKSGAEPKRSGAEPKKGSAEPNKSGVEPIKRAAEPKYVDVDLESDAVADIRLAPYVSSHGPLVESVEMLTESMLQVWLSHSRTLRLSVLEKAHEKRVWNKVVGFIKTYGAELFTQNLLNMGNIRSILHQSVPRWLRELREDGEFGGKLLEDLDAGTIDRTDAIECLTLILEAVQENYGEYRDYNSTTTQSDRGELIYTLLDFLRLRTRYDRIAWNLKPVVWAHEVLIRKGQDQAAEIWRRALRDRVGNEAERFLTELKELQTKYAMRMPTIADRLGERFLRPLSIDRVRALVEPAVAEAETREAGESAIDFHPTFDRLEQQAEKLTRTPTGVGLDVPPWLIALDEEVQRVRDPLSRNEHRAALQSLFPSREISRKQLAAQLRRFKPKDT